MNIIEKAIEKLDGGASAPAQAAEGARRPADTPGVPAGVGERTERVEPGATQIHAGSTARVDLHRLSGLGFVTAESVQSPVAEQFRLIKRSLLAKTARDRAEGLASGNLIMVTSALPGEGKSYVAINLAMAIAMERDRTVLLVDADVAKSDVSRVLDIQCARGLTDLLGAPETDLADVVVETDVPKLTVLPAGRTLPNAPDLFSGPNMRHVIEVIARRYAEHVVIFDSAPLLYASGTSALAALVDQVVMVAEAFRTPQSALREGLAMLDEGPKVTMLLNKSRERIRSYYYPYRSHGG